MLNHLHIENIAVVETADIDFLHGFNVLTGETGAGKSIVIDAINAVLGARTSKDIIRVGCNKALVVAEFVITSQIKKLLEENEIPFEEDTLIIQRTLSSDGKSSFRINGLPTQASTVREIGRNLLNIHGQHDNQALLDASMHIGYIDRLADNGKILDSYQTEFKNFISLRNELQSLQIDDAEKERKLDLLKYQISEIEAADIKIGEYETLKEKLKLAQSFEKTYKTLNSAYTAISGEDTIGAEELLKNAAKDIISIDNVALGEVVASFSEALENLYNAKQLLRDYIDKNFSEKLDVDEISDRIEVISRLLAKYGGTEEKVLDYFTNAKADLEKITFADERAEQLAVLLQSSQERLVEKGKMLTESRKKTALKFEKSVVDILKYLDMPSVVFTVDFKMGKYTKSGADVVEFLISANKGEPPKPLSKITSGGELSRVMLAIKSVLANTDEVPTLIFDEIDSGISGHAALKVAEQIKKLAIIKQILCVTHLAQIASYADNHLLVEKSSDENKTYTIVKSLDYDGRINEIARIMSGAKVTEKLFDSAKELLDRSSKNANL